MDDLFYVNCGQTIELTKYCVVMLYSIERQPQDLQTSPCRTGCLCTSIDNLFCLSGQSLYNAPWSVCLFCLFYYVISYVQQASTARLEADSLWSLNSYFPCVFVFVLVSVCAYLSMRPFFYPNRVSVFSRFRCLICVCASLLRCFYLLIVNMPSVSSISSFFTLCASFLLTFHLSFFCCVLFSLCLPHFFPHRRDLSFY